MIRRIDLNADLGEGYGAWAMGDDAGMLDLVTSANIACGGHAGDPEVMFATLTRARDLGVRIGAHPGFADREGFGRRLIPCTPAEVTRLVAAQIGALMGVAALAGARVAYVKPHGALGNLAADDAAIAAAIAEAAATVAPDLALLAISGTALEAAACARGVAVFSEVFADRAYLPTGRLVPRSRPGALLADPAEATRRMLDFLATGLMPTLDGPAIPLAAHSICVHGDSPHAVAMARTLRAALSADGVTLAPFCP